MEKELTIPNIKTAASLGVALKRLRKQQDLGQEELAQMVGIRQATISDIENGRGTLDSFLKIIQVLKINLTLSNRSTVEMSSKKSKAGQVLDLLDD